MGLALYATFLFLKASSKFANYNDALKRVTKGKKSIPSWRFILPIKEIENEIPKMKERRMDHEKYISRYWIIVILLLVMVSFTAMSAKY